MTLDQNTVDNGVKVLQTVGFPTAVALWFMFRTDRKTDEHTKSISLLTLAVNKLSEKIEAQK